jgi:VWFA-related protein
VGRIPLVLGVLIPLIVRSAGAQDTSPQQPTFKSGVELVTIDAIVVDKDGHPVKGLQADDFIVTLDGQVRPVRLLDYREYGSSSESDASAQADASNRPQRSVGQTRGGRLVVIVFDDLSYRPAAGKMLLASAERLLSSFAPDDLIGIVTTSGLGPAINPTRDRASIVAALHSKKMIGRYDDSSAQDLVVVTQEEALQIVRDFPHQTYLDVLRRNCGSQDETTQCASQVRNNADVLGEMTLRRAAQQLSAYQQVIHALSVATDLPRVIIALTSGVALGLDSSEYADGLDKISDVAAESNVRFYALSELPDTVDFSRNLSPQLLQAEGRFLNGGAQAVANAAGGEAFLVSGTADRFIKRIETETSAYYRLAVEAPPAAAGHRYLKTTVRVRQPGVSVRAAHASIVPTGAAAVPNAERALRTRLEEGGTSFGVPLTAGAELRRDPTNANRIEIDVSVDVPGRIKGPVTMMYGLLNDAGKIIDAGTKEVARSAQADYRLAFPISVNAGTYHLRVAVSDADGDIGSVEKPISASLTHIGTYTVSDLLIASAGPDGISRLVALDAIPQDARTLSVALELYPDDVSIQGGLQVRFELLPSDQTTAIATTAIVPSGSGNARIASASLPIATLGPGSYRIRATVLANGAAVGAESATFRKAS